MSVAWALVVVIGLSACRQAPSTPPPPGPASVPAPEQLTYLHLLYDDRRGDNLTTAALGPEEPSKLTSDFRSARLEARILRHPAPGTVPLRLFQREGDFLTAARPATVERALDAGYREVARLGFVFAAPRPGLRALRLFHSKERGDFFLTGTEIGARSAVDAGYREVGVEGWAYQSKAYFAESDVPLLAM